MSNRVRKDLWCLLAGLWMAGLIGVRAFDASTLSEVGLGLGSNNYWSRPAFANALWDGEAWLEYGENEWGSPVSLEGNPQFGIHGLPRYLNPGKKLRALLFALHANPSPRPSTWPDRTLLARGKVAMTWQGDADIRLEGGEYLPDESSGSSTGRLVHGRRVYRFGEHKRLQWLTVEAVDPANPITELKAWLPDPSDPERKSLEGELFHPTFLARLRDAPWAFLRFMVWNESNASPQQDWQDRRLPRHVVQLGVLNRRSPAPGFAGDRQTGVALEHMVALGNTVGRDIWICIPHLATEDFITKTAQLIRFGSDGTNPYTGPVTSAIYPGLKPGLRVFVEYSNEIWSGGDAFCQGHWAEAQAQSLGLGRAQFVAGKFCDVWRIFQTVFSGQTERVVRVAAVFSAGQSYTEQFLREIAVHGRTLAPPQTADIISPTTYFGNGIQDWAYLKAQDQANTADPWFLQTNTYARDSISRPVSVPASKSYWQGENVSRHLSETILEWKRRLLSGASQPGAGPDETGASGGFETWLRTASVTAFGTVKPLVSYEGGPSIYTSHLDTGDMRDAGITTFMEMLNRHPGMADVYRIHLNLAKARGLRTHGAFVESGAWGRYGQWGHLEFADQDPQASAKWRFLLQWPQEVAGLRPVDEPFGERPSFTTPSGLPVAVVGEPYDQEITATGGDGPSTLQVIETVLPRGLALSASGAGSLTLRLRGTPEVAGDGYFLVRARDADGDAAWRTFHVKSVGGSGTLLEASFEGENPGQHPPWTSAYVLREGVGYSGFHPGSGMQPAAGNDGLFWSQIMEPDEASETLSKALDNQTFWEFTLTPAAGQTLDLRKQELRFAIRRIDYHAPRQYAFFSSIDGYNPGKQFFESKRIDDDAVREFVCVLPDTPAYGQVDTPVSFRLYSFAGQYAWHRTSLTALRLGTKSILPPVIVAQPEARSVLLGAEARFQVNAAGDGLRFQWSKDGALVPGAVGSSLTLSNVQPADAAVYAVVVQNGAGTIASADARLNLVTAERIDGFLQRDLFTGIPEGSIAYLLDSEKYPDHPDRTDIVSSIESRDLGDDYGLRLSGFVTAPTTGDYIFYIAGRDQAALYLSTDENPAHKTLIATEPVWAESRNWVGTDWRNPVAPENISRPIPMLAGRRYYIEVLQKLGWFFDYVAVNWQLPGQGRPVNGSDPIGSAYLSYSQLKPYAEPPTVPTVNRRPSLGVAGLVVDRVLRNLTNIVPSGENGQRLVPTSESFGEGDYRLFADGLGLQFRGLEGTDDGAFAYQTVSGDFDARVRLVAMDRLRPETAVGLMVRETMDPLGRMLNVLAHPNGMTQNGRTGAEVFQTTQRPTINGLDSLWDSGEGGGVVSLPNAWIRLRREGQVFTAYWSSDGAGWIQIGQHATIPAFRRMCKSDWASIPAIEAQGRILKSALSRTASRP